jgi:mRNA-degrading endonuclease RelE of RelBE toxin-antitoxin system
LRIETTSHFDRALDTLPIPIQEQIETSISVLAESFGKPHAHRGVRKLGQRLYEFRVGLHLRIVFRHEPDTLYLLLIGTHDEVRRFIRNL